jgi:hypothetical protein
LRGRRITNDVELQGGVAAHVRIGVGARDLHERLPQRICIGAVERVLVHDAPERVDRGVAHRRIRIAERELLERRDETGGALRFEADRVHAHRTHGGVR